MDQDSLWLFRKGLALSYIKWICCSLFWSETNHSDQSATWCSTALEQNGLACLTYHCGLAPNQISLLQVKLYKRSSACHRELAKLTLDWGLRVVAEPPLCSDCDQGIWWPQGNDLCCLQLALAPYCCCIKLLRSIQDLIWHPLELQTSGMALVRVIS